MTKKDNSAAIVNHESSSSDKIDDGKLWQSIYFGYGPEGNDATQKEARENIKKYIRQVVEDIEVSKEYNVLILFDSSRMMKGDADKIYNAVTTFKDKKPLLLILMSNGGEIGSAYLIGKLCLENSNNKFVICVPRQAKSAATLLCCAAEEIHLGSLSELGPIDPQIDNFPALGLKHSIEHIAQLVKATPESAEMFARYLNYSLNPINLGYYERVAVSATQYAMKLLETHKAKLPNSPEFIANSLVYTYKDHGFVIDKGEAALIFGDSIIKTNTKEYFLANAVYKALNSIKINLNIVNNNFYFIGSLDSEPTIYKR